MSVASENLASMSSQADARALASAQSTERVSAHVDVVASSIQDIAATLTAAAGDAEKTSAVAAAARHAVEAAQDDAKALTEAAHTIEQVIALIEDVAGQTNLLALNATIEAARAGEMGRGFAVVAHEVKQLATRTSRATEEVRGGLHGITAASLRIAERVAKLVQSIDQVAAVAAAIAELDPQAGCQFARNYFEHGANRRRRARSGHERQGRGRHDWPDQASGRAGHQGVDRSGPASE